MTHLFCFGLGYSAEALVRRLDRSRWTVSGTTRSPEKAQALRGLGVNPVLFAADRPIEAPETVFAPVTHILVSAPPGDGGDPVLAAYGERLADLAPDLQWVGYLSTTGVYGDRGGDWVDEESPRDPSTDRGRRRVAAEDAWFAFGRRTGVPVMSFRLAGIYGPGRNQLVSLREGKARRIRKEGQVFSRIHVEDIALAVERGMAAPASLALDGRAYNVCDNEPAPPGEVVTFAAELMGIEPPPWEEFEAAMTTMSPMGRSFYSESKRVSNRRLKQDLEMALRYPTYRDGLRALWEAGESR